MAVRRNNRGRKRSLASSMTKVTIGKLKSVPDALQRSIGRTQVEYRRLGKSGLRVSNPILGGLHIGDSRWFPWVLDEEKVSLLDFTCPLLMMSWDNRDTVADSYVGAAASEGCI